MQYDNEAFTDDDQSEDRPAASPSVSPSSARPSPRLLPPLRERVAETSDAELSSGSQTPSSVASSRVTAADRDRRRRRPSESAELAEKTLVEEATEFFTRKWTKEVAPGSARETMDKEAKEARRSSAVDSGEITSEGATPDVNENSREADEDEENLLTSDDYVPDEQLACKIVKAEYKPSVDSNLHFPSSSKVPLSAKVRDAHGNEDDSSDRTRPGSLIRNNLCRFAMNQMEHRLINQGAMHCVPYRCDSEPELELELDVSSLKFQHHPLFSSEHVLAAQLTSLYDAEQRQKADAQTDTLKAVVEKMKRVWEDVEQLRRTQGYTSTALTLKFRRRYKATESEGAAEDIPPQDAPVEEGLFSEEVELRRLLQQVEWMEYERKLHLWHQHKRLKVYETRGVLSQKLADVLVPVPEAEQTTSNTHLAAIHFASEKTVSTSHAGVGCGVRLEVGRGGPLWLSLNGELTCSLAWADSAAGRNVVIRTGTAMNARARVTQRRAGKGRLGTILNRSKLRALSQEPQENLRGSAMREQVLRQVYESQTHKVLEDVVIEEKMPFIGSLGFGLLKLAKRRRPLRPSRRERRRVTGQSAAAADAEILVTVLRASNVPVRRDTEVSATHRAPRTTSVYSGLLDDVVEYQVRPFVEIMFQQRTARTFVADGPHPTWNQELRLPITPEQCVVKDVIYLNLFDEVVLDLLEDDRERHSTVHQRLERRWLGSLKIPFSTLYINAKIEGTFRIDVPVVLLGYAHEVKPWSPAQDAPASSTYVSFYMTVEPGLQSPEVLRARCDSNEPPQLVQQAEEWQSSLESRYPRRFVKALAMDASGKWVFVPRFLRPLAPPQQLLDSARRPSLVEDVSSTAKEITQFLRVLTGDEEEHALLLCNYFLHLGTEAYLLLGSGIPEGQTAYVLTRNSGRSRDGDVRIWNAVTGRSYSVTDSYGPLQTVGCLVGVDNPSELSYEPTDPLYVSRLQQKIEYALKESVMKWRKRFRTSWNRYASQMSGFPLSMSFTDVETVIETVLSTGVHLTESRNVEFALAVHIHPYPSGVLAVWVYIAALTRKS
ncbi:hypothetical protein HPB52_004041 [Rhipicephalus sanguineus]|uniref:C2 domain-containing protein n=1 Tax=Rhipicephalus sanguineus TaxID=34632 RepID=A0A9D4T5G5_RHISA|nr:hypothetical protein HPB52_004041 [Rhipicephalus sanguineus]